MRLNSISKPHKNNALAMQRTVQTLDQLRQYFTENARQVRVEGVADTVAVGYVRHYGSQFSYIVFYGKQAKPAKHFSAKDEAQAEQRIIEALTQAGKVAERKAQNRKSGRAPYYDRQEGDITCRSYTVAGTAQLIREALKKAFPGVKFSVTSDSFAGGSAVDIRYTDGPSRKQVEQVYAPFISGHYNSSEDMYEYHREPTTVDESGKLFRMSYGAKYIHAHRNYSPAYGFFLNALDLRQAPALAEQFPAFYKWHSAQRYNMQTSWGENAGTYTVSSNSSHGDLERFAEALTVQGYAPTLTTAGDEVTLTVIDSPSAAPAGPVVAPAREPADDQTDPSAEITTDAHAAQVAARIDAIWALAEERWQQGGRPLRFIGCSYTVADSRQMEDRSAYLSEAEAAEVHQLTLQHSLYTNDPHRAHQRVQARLAELRAQRQLAGEATQEPADDQTAREYRAAEMHWLSDPGQDNTDREYEAAERGWLAAA